MGMLERPEEGKPPSTRISDADRNQVIELLLSINKQRGATLEHPQCRGQIASLKAHASESRMRLHQGMGMIRPAGDLHRQLGVLERLLESSEL